MRDANSEPASLAKHARLLESSHALNSIRVRQSDGESVAKSKIRVAAWNVERCKFVEETAQLLSAEAVDVALLSEADIGLVRSGNRDTIADLASELGMNHVAGVEFIELGLGDERETAECAGGVNAAGLHCNAILSRFSIVEAIAIPLGPGGDWFAGKPGKGQRRVGSRIALGACIAASIPIWVFSIHFESEGGPIDRSGEAKRFVASLETANIGEVAIAGGDFNFSVLPDEAFANLGTDLDLGACEPAFGVFQEAGFEWSRCNAPGPTTRPHPWTTDYKPKKIDWMFMRKVEGSNPSIVPAVGPDGCNLSDHEMILADICLGL